MTDKHTQQLNVSNTNITIPKKQPECHHIDRSSLHAAVSVYCYTQILIALETFHLDIISANATSLFRFSMM